MSDSVDNKAKTLAPMRRLLAAAALAISLVAGAHDASARDLGVQGKVWPIVEIDIRELLIGSAARADLSKIEDELRQSAEAYLDNLPKRTMRQASHTQTRWIDPSFVLDNDIRAPIQNTQGEWEWSVLLKKGTRFNPLSVQRPHNAMFFFNGSSKQEVAFAAALLKHFPAKVMIIEAAGVNPEKLSTQLGGPVFSATAAMLARFQIQTTPTLLYPGEGAQQLRLGLTEFGSPYSAAQAEQAWPSIRMPTTGGSR